MLTFKNTLALITLSAITSASTVSVSQAADTLPIADAHIHYSHDSVDMTPPERVIELMRDAGLKFALVSSSDDRGTQLLRDLAPDLIVPSLRPYTRRGQSSSWFTSEEILAYVEQLLQENQYAAIGEFHLYGSDADLPIPQRIVELADEHNLILHAHSDAEAVERLLAQSETAKVIWAHSGFDKPEAIGQMLDKHDRLWADLAFRADVVSRGELTDDWKALFAAHPDRIMLGTDTYTPERMYFIPEHAATARQWLESLPAELAEGIAWKNAFDLIMPVWQENKSRRSEQSTVDTTMAVETHKAGDQPAPNTIVPSDDETELTVGLSCDDTVAGFVLHDDTMTVSIQPLGEIAVSQPFNVGVTVCGEGAQDARITLDATMPAHGHGMNYAPPHTVLAQAEEGQQIEVEGLLLHMPGNWQWEVEIITHDDQISLTQEFMVR